MLDVLHRGIEAGDPMPRIAARAGVSAHLCFKKARELGWLSGPSPRPDRRKERVRWTQAMLDVLRGGIEARDAMPRIAAHVGVSEQPCFKKARQLGWLPGPRPRAGTRRADG